MTTIRFKFEQRDFRIQGPYTVLDVTGGYADIDETDTEKISLAKQWGGVREKDKTASKKKSKSGVSDA